MCLIGCCINISFSGSNSIISNYSSSSTLMNTGTFSPVTEFPDLESEVAATELCTDPDGIVNSRCVFDILNTQDPLYGVSTWLLESLYEHADSIIGKPFCSVICSSRRSNVNSSNSSGVCVLSGCGRRLL